MQNIAFHHAALACHDPAATEEFYVRHFGFRRARAIPLPGGEQSVFLCSGDAYLELFQAKEGSPLAPPSGDGPSTPGVRHLAFKVPNVDAALAELGGDARVTLGPLDFDAFIPGWRTVWVADPDGNILEISQGYVDDPALEATASGQSQYERVP